MNSLKYTAAYTLPLSALLGIWLGGWWSFLTPVYAFLAIPLLETLLPQDNSNLKPADRATDGINPVFDLMLYVNLIIVYGLIWFVGEVYTSSSSFSLEWVGVAFSLGIVLGTNGINVGH